MANRYDNTSSWSPFPAPATSLIWPHGGAASCRFSSSPAAFENDALASALLQASMMPPPPSSPTPSSSTTTSSASELSSVHHHDTPAPAPHGAAANNKVQARRGKGRGGVSKRKPKPRPSRRAPTTYIIAAPADFRRMVQEVTGLAVPAGAGAAAACPVASASWPQDQLAFVLPTLDTSASFMLDRAPLLPPLQRWDDKAMASSDGAATAMAAPTAREETVPEDYPSLFLMRELEMMVGAPAAASSFPTLESWGMI